MFFKNCKMRTLEQIAKIDKRRKEALASRDAISYFYLCNEVGIEPEDIWLYERGYLEHKQKVNLISKTNKYQNFLKEAQQKGVSINRFQDISVKKRLLEKYFPGQFRKQNLKKYGPRQIGEIFAKIFDYAKS